MPEKYKNKYRIPSARLQGYDYGQNGAYFITICTKNRVHYFGEIIDPVEAQHLGSRETHNNAGTHNNASLQATPIGVIANEYWHKIPEHFPFIILDEFVIMPNHVHGILVISKETDGDRPGSGTHNIASGSETHNNAPGSETHNNASGSETHNITSGSEAHNNASGSETHNNASGSETHNNASGSETHNNASGSETHNNASGSETHNNASGSETHNNASLQEIGYANKFGPQSGNISSVMRGYKAAVKSFATTNKIKFAWQPRFYDRIIRDDEEMKRTRKYIVENPDNWFRDKNNKEDLFM